MNANKNIFPVYPQSRPLRLDDKPVLDELFARLQPKGCEMTFAHIYCWAKEKNIEASSWQGVPLIFYAENGPAFLPTFSPKEQVDIAAFLRSACSAGATAPRLWRYPKEYFDALGTESGLLRYTLERDQFDYVYNRDDLALLKGRRYDGKRNHISRFKKKYSYQIRAIGDDLAQAACDFCCAWCEKSGCTDEMKEEVCAALMMIRNSSKLGLSTMAVIINEKIAALSVGEPLNRDTFVVHVEKADSDFEGIYQFINQAFCASIPEHFKFINREQDVGVEGLRKAKLSYYPAYLVEKGALLLA